MKILALVGSYRKNGNTARIVDMIVEELYEIAPFDARNDEEWEIETIYLAHQDIRPCRGCRVCFDRGETECPLKDNLLAIRTKMEKADGLIIASPTYVNDVNGAVKNWIDRLAFECHRPEFGGKCAYLVATVADGPTKHALRTLNMALRTWGFHIVGQSGFKTGALMQQAEMEACHRETTEKIAQRFYCAINKRLFIRPSFLALMTFKIQQLYWQRNIEDSIDFTYWKSRGWTEPRREFFIQHRANPVKVAFARMAGTLIARFVI